MSGKEVDGRQINLDFAAGESNNANPQARANERAKKHGDTVSPESDTLFVGNLPFDVDQDMVREFFGDVAEVASLRLPTDPYVLPVPKPINHNADHYPVRAETSRVSATLPSTLLRTPSPSSRLRTVPPLVAAVCLVPCVLTTLLPVLPVRAVVASVVAVVVAVVVAAASVAVADLVVVVVASVAVVAVAVVVVVVSVVAAVATPAPRSLSIKVGNLRALARVSRVGVWA